MLNRHRLIGWMQIGAVPLLLLLVALRQITLAHTVGLSPWHGGGFGMFASVDRDERRLIKVTGLDQAGTEIQIDLTEPNALFSERDLILIRTVPRPKLLQSVAQQVLSAPLQATQEGEGGPVYRLAAAQDDAIAPATPPLQTIRVQVWRLHHNRETQAVWYAPVSEAVEVTR